MKKTIVVAFLALIVFSLLYCSVIKAQNGKTFSSAKEIVQAMAAKAETIKDYTMTIFYTGAPGVYILDYSCVRPNNIKTRIAAGKNARTVLLYLPNEKPDSLKCKKGIARKWMSIEELKLKNTPIVESLLDDFLKILNEYPEGTIRSTEKLTLNVGQEVSVSSEKGTITMDKVTVGKVPETKPTPDASPSPSVDPSASASPSATPSASPSASPSVMPTFIPPPPDAAVPQTQTLEKTCYIVEFKKDNVIDLMAIDTESLWVLYRKKIVDGKVDEEAVVWNINENTSPKIEF
ncbi:MAG: hypothetical protein AB2L14_24025 [Candidatus Xenobiia bacterium LiM19]